MARPLLADPAEEFPGNATFSVGGAILLPYTNRIRGTLSAAGKVITTSILGRESPCQPTGEDSGRGRSGMPCKA